MSILSEIVERKRQRVESAKRTLQFDGLERRSNPHRLRRALLRDGINIIAEFKRRSPSKGLIRADADLKQIVKSYETGGAAALSVLTEEDYFSGSLEDLRTAKSIVDLPVLRKDFIFDEYQVYESAAAGADAVLLIVAVLDDENLAALRSLAEDDLGLDALVEVHTREEMQRALACGASLIGVNNRNLHDFTVSLDTSLSLAQDAPGTTVLVSESGLHGAADLSRLHDAGYRGFLIGEALMRSEEPAVTLRVLRGAS